MAQKKENGNLLIICATIVISLGIVSTVLMIMTTNKSEVPEGWLALFFGFMGAMLTGLLSAHKLEKIGKTVDDLNNGRADAKMRAAVADVVADQYLDPNQSEQIAQDRIRRDSGA